MSDELVCTACGHVGSSKTIANDHFALEVVFWLCFLIPGFIYPVWRHTSRYGVCRVCGKQNLSPKTAQIAQKFLEENFPEKLVVRQEKVRPPSRAAKRSQQVTLSVAWLASCSTRHAAVS